MQRSHNSSLITLRSPASPYSESYRKLRTNIQFSSLGAPVKALLVTSAIQGEGKSTTVGNLAIAYAEEGKSVLVVDADLRTPAIHRLFHLKNQAGLSTVITNQTGWKEAIQATDINRLSILTSGPVPSNPSEMLSNPRMGEIISALKEQYDVVLIDASPVNKVTDSLIISAHCDGVILVVAAGKADKEIVKNTKISLERVNSRIVGVVLNNVKRKEK